VRHDDDGGARCAGSWPEEPPAQGGSLCIELDVSDVERVALPCHVGQCGTTSRPARHLPLIRRP
jgi:hypothetical protein